MYKQALEKVPLFADCDPGFLDALCTEVKPQISLPGDYIVRQGDIGLDMFFIASGVAEAVDERGKVCQPHPLFCVFPVVLCFHMRFLFHAICAHD